MKCRSVISADTSSQLFSIEVHGRSNSVYCRAVSRPDTEWRSETRSRCATNRLKEMEVSDLIHPDATALVGNTPLVELSRLSRALPGRVVAKLEVRNPAGSVKDRLGLALIDDAERRGVLKPGGTVIEATGGNTGIGLAFVAAIRSYRLILTMPASMSMERVALLRQYGADVILTPGILMTDAVARAKELAETVPGSLYIDQFSNPANPDLHRRTTGPEIWDDTFGAVDIFVSAVGTGGTITGVGEVLKSRKPSVKIVAVEPTEQPYCRERSRARIKCRALVSASYPKS